MIVTLATAGIMGLILLALSVRVSMRRREMRIGIGSGGDLILQSRIRAQANFTEYVPIALILLFLCEQATASKVVPVIAATLLIVGRLLHPLGMAPGGVMALRAAGMVCTWAAILILSIAALVAAIHLA